MRGGKTDSLATLPLLPLLCDNDPLLPPLNNMQRRFYSSKPFTRNLCRRYPADGRIRLTFLVLGVGVAVGLFLVWERGQSPSSFPEFETGRYVGVILDPQAAGSLVAVPLIVDVPDEGDPVLLMLDDNVEGGASGTRLPQSRGGEEPVVITIAGGEQIRLVGSREGTIYQGIGTRASGSELQWALRPVKGSGEGTPSDLKEFLEQRAKMALLDRRIESAKAGVAKASDESAQFKQTATSPDRSLGSSTGKALSATDQPKSVDEERARVESKRAELVQKISLLESVAPGSRVARSAYRTHTEQKRWLNNVLLSAPAPSMNPEDAEAVQRGIEVDKLQRAIVAAQRRIDAVLRASDDILGE